MGIAVLFHEGATVLVVLNALRLLRFADLPAEGTAPVLTHLKPARPPQRTVEGSPKGP
jgi:hypothetical protein